jgi:hypothetical protein
MAICEVRSGNYQIDIAEVRRLFSFSDFNIKTPDFRAIWKKVIVAAPIRENPSYLEMLCDEINPKIKAFALSKFGESASHEDYFEHGNKVLTSLFRMAEELDPQLLVKLNDTVKKQQRFCLTHILDHRFWHGINRFKSFKELKPWTKHLTWIVNEIDHDIDLRRFSFPSEIGGIFKVNQDVKCTLKVDAYHSGFGHNFRLMLYDNENEIGTLAFYFVRLQKFIFVHDIQNMTIRSGVREYSKVGTALMDYLKNLGAELGYVSIRLLARAPLNTPLPSNSKVVEFYEKLGFVKTGEGFLEDGGHRMQFTIDKE